MIPPSILGEVYITVPGERSRPSAPASVPVPDPKPTPQATSPESSTKPQESPTGSGIPFGKIAAGTVVLAILVGIGLSLEG